MNSVSSEDANFVKDVIQSEESYSVRSSESFGLKWLFNEEDNNEKGNKKRNRKRQLISEEFSSSEETSGKLEIKKKRPNYFIALRISDDKIHEVVKTFQNDLIKENSKLKAALISPSTLHITIAVMYLDATQLNIAHNALEECSKDIITALKNVDFKLTFCGVGNFGNKVIFADIKTKEQIECLRKINSIITQSFEKNELFINVEKEYYPHLTLLKLSKNKSLKKSGIRKVNRHLYLPWINSIFGEETIKNLYLCSMQGMKEDDGFYECIATVSVNHE